MKIVINLKDPDGVYTSLEEAGMVFLGESMIKPEHEEAIDKFISFMEYVSIEIDTETLTAKVLPCSQ